MRQNLAGWEGGIGRWWELLRATLPRSRIPSQRRREVRSLFPAVSFQLASSCRYQDFSKPVAQVAGALALEGMFCRLPDKCIVLWQETDSHRRAMSTRFLYLWPSHREILDSNGTTSQVENLCQTS